jgi:hypothetical protein
MKSPDHEWTPRTRSDIEFLVLFAPLFIAIGLAAYFFEPGLLKIGEDVPQ